MVCVCDFLDALLLGFFFLTHKIVSPSSEASLHFIGTSLEALVFHLFTRVSSPAGQGDRRKEQPS